MNRQVRIGVFTRNGVRKKMTAIGKRRVNHTHTFSYLENIFRIVLKKGYRRPVFRRNRIHKQIVGIVRFGLMEPPDVFESIESVYHPLYFRKNPH